VAKLASDRGSKAVGARQSSNSSMSSTLQHGCGCQHKKARLGQLTDMPCAMSTTHDKLWSNRA